MPMTVIKTKNITKSYGKHIAVNNVNLNVNSGDIYGLIGKNGAGKTTLLRLVSGLILPNKGQVEICSESSVSGLQKSRNRMGCMIETPSFYPYLSATKNLEYYRIQRGIIEKTAIDEALELVGLDKNEHKKFKNFSLGMKQRLGLALAIMDNPDILILDEPINGLDPTGIVEFRELLRNLNEQKHTTILISSHLLTELSQIATKYGFINDGELIEEIGAKELQDNVRHCVSVKVNDVGCAVVVIEKELKCTDYEVLNNNEIRIYQFVEHPEVIAKALINNDVVIYGLNQIGANLENYFIELVGGNHNA